MTPGPSKDKIAPTHHPFSTGLTTMKLFSFAFAIIAPLIPSIQPEDMAPATGTTFDSNNIFIPHILFPHDGTVWKTGHRHNVT